MKNENNLVNKVDLVDALIKRGELIKAFDASMEALQYNKNLTILKHRAVLCLANSGALKAASEEFKRLGLDQVAEDEEVLCLYGKILKSQAVASKNKEKKELALHSVDQYKRAYYLNKSFYPGINLATVLLLSGDVKGSRAMANEVLNNIDNVDDKDIEDSYYRFASKAEAFLLLNKLQETKTNLGKAISNDPANYRAHASTIKQFELIIKLQNKSCRWLDSFRPPNSIYYGGYIFSTTNENNRLSKVELYDLEDNVSKKVQAMNVGFGYGSLAAGSDIIIAETILSLAAELNVILPINLEKFIEKSVAPFGEEWVERFHSCIKRATSVQISSENLTSLDETLLKFSSQVAMGKAILRAGTLATNAKQLLIWAGEKNDNISMTHSDHNIWQRTGFKQEEIILSNLAPNLKGAKKLSSSNNQKRTIAAMIFADFHKFSELNEEQVSVFSKHVLKSLSKTLKQSNFKPFEVNTWGDGLFLAFENVVDAANCSLLLQNCFSKLDLAKLGLPKNLSLRIGANYGPVFSGIDAFLEKDTVFGPNVTFAARIEPITVPGSIYVSENFASVLAAQPNVHFNCEYIGLVKLNKSKDFTPIYSIHSAG